MKKVLLVMVFAVLVLGCRQKSPEEMAKLKGTWQVINVNCPDVLAEKDGVRQIFTAPANSLGHCIDKVEPGWIVEVDSTGDFAFFPPVQPKAPETKPQ